MPADTLLSLSLRASVRLASRITSVGDLPPHLALPIISKVPSPAQLHTITLASPQLLGHLDSLWLAFLKRDVPNYASKPHRPSNPASWYKVYKKLKKEADADMKRGEEGLKAALGAIKDKKAEQTAVMVDRKDMPLGSTGVGWRQKAAYGYMTGKTGSKGASKLSLFEKIRKEKADAKHAKYQRPTAVNRNMVEKQRGETDRIIAERRKLEEQKRLEKDHLREGMMEQATAAQKPRAPRRTSSLIKDTRPDYAPVKGVAKAPPGRGYDLTSDREARLSALKNNNYSHSSATAAATSSSNPTSLPLTGQKRNAEAAGLDAGDLEDLFDDEDLVSEDSENDDELFGTIPRTHGSAHGRPQPEIKKQKITTSPEKALPLDHRKMLSPALNGDASRQRSVSPARIGSPQLKPTVKRKAPPSLFHTTKRPVVRPQNIVSILE